MLSNPNSRLWSLFRHSLTKTAGWGFVFNVSVLPLLELLFHSPSHDTSVLWTPGKISQPTKKYRHHFNTKNGKFYSKKLWVKKVIIFNESH